MKCEPFNGPTGSTGFVCSRSRRKQSCSVPGCGRAALRECDHPVVRKGGARSEKAGTCERALCATCAVKIGITREGDSVDFCPPHATHWRENERHNFRSIAPAIRQIAGIRGVIFRETDEYATRFIVSASEPRSAKGRPPVDETSIPLEHVQIAIPLWKIAGRGAKDPVSLAAAITPSVISCLAELAHDERTFLVVSRAPFAFESPEHPKEADWDISANGFRTTPG